jgi:hypothetical protein
MSIEAKSSLAEEQGQSQRHADEARRRDGEPLVANLQPTARDDYRCHGTANLFKG